MWNQSSWQGEWIRIHERETLRRSVLGVLLLLLLFSFVMGPVLQQLSFQSIQRRNSLSLPILEVELATPSKSILVESPDKNRFRKESEEAKKIIRRPAPSRNESSKDQRPADETKNQTEPRSMIPETRGPRILSSPAPRIPRGLRNENLRAQVVIEFEILASGAVTPRLVRSGGNDELDALALQAARSWTFQPAMREGKVIDSKVKLRIDFEVE